MDVKREHFWFRNDLDVPGVKTGTTPTTYNYYDGILWRIFVCVYFPVSKRKFISRSVGQSECKLKVQHVNL